MELTMRTTSYDYEVPLTPQARPYANWRTPGLQRQAPRQRSTVGRIFLRILGILGGVLAILLGIGQIINAVSTTPAIARVEMAHGLDSQNRASGVTTTFSPSDKPIHCVVTLRCSPPNTKIKVVWYLVEAPGKKPNQKIYEHELTTTERSKNVGDFFLTSSLPVGSYRADVYLNDKLEQTCPFQVK
jgi:hypothetical protein